MVRIKQISCIAVILTLSFSVVGSSKVSAASFKENSKENASGVEKSIETSEVIPKQFEELELEKVYYEDLNYDGKEEKVVCKQTDVKNDDSKKILTIYINDKTAFNKTLECQSIRVNLADIDADDNLQDMFVTTNDYGAICLETFYLQYRESKLKLIQAIRREDGPKYFNLAQYFFGEVSDDASFQLITTRPIADAIGDYDCIIPYQLVDGKLSAVKTSTYSLTHDSKKYVYEAKKKFVTYKSIKTGAATSFVIKIGDKVTADKIYVTSKGKCYIRIINSKNEKGWINGSKEDLFVKAPIYD